MIELRQEEINQVGGGMKWCYGEMSDNVIVDGSVSEDTRMQWAVGGGCGGLRDNIPHLDFVCWSGVSPKAPQRGQWSEAAGPFWIG